VVVCPTQAILVGDLHDPATLVSQIIQREAVTVRRPEKKTLPTLFYKGAHQATLDPLAARRPEGGLFLWSEQPALPDTVVSGNPHFGNSSAAALLCYDIAHAMPWDWRVSLYTWTKGSAAGAYLVALLLVLTGFLPADHALWRWLAPLLSGTMLAVTGGLLLWDLEHPERFLLIFTRPQWRSWLVRGAFIITGYGLVLLLHCLASWGGALRLHYWLMIPGLPLATLTAVYTAYLFAQAKGRDLWQNPLLPPHLLLQALLLGSASLLPLTLVFQRDAVLNRALPPMLWLLALTSLVHVLMVGGEVSLTHATAHARLAVWEMVKGRYRSDFWIGMVLSIIGGVGSWLAITGAASQSVGIACAPLALVGLMLYENAYVQAGQAVPLA
jgi:formate-dependent nitrite reductase membrane component NrfD